MPAACMICRGPTDAQGRCPGCSVGNVSTASLPPPGGPPTVAHLPAPADDPDQLDDLLRGIAEQSHFEDRYKVLGQLAAGGMGSICRAYDRILRREVAIKRMLRADSRPARGQFLKEARVGGRLLHPNVLAVFDLGVNRAGHLYYTMRLVNGASLQHTLAALDLGVNTKLVGFPLRKLVAAFLGVCRGVDYAHQNGVLHLDLKPANVLMSGFEEVFVIDWGLARVDDVDDTDQLVDLYRHADPAQSGRFDATGAGGQVVGTPAYMAPEQARGEVGEFRPATDVYGLGGVLYHILYGVAPNHGASLYAVLASAGQPKPVPPLRAGILPRGRRVKPATHQAVAALEAIALRALDPDPDRRYATADHLVCELDEWLAAVPA